MAVVVPERVDDALGSDDDVAWKVVKEEEESLDQQDTERRSRLQSQFQYRVVRLRLHESFRETQTRTMDVSQNGLDQRSTMDDRVFYTVVVGGD